MSALAVQFVDWAWDLTAAGLPPDVRRATRRHLLDGWGCALAAARLDLAGPALAVARETTAPRQAAVPGIEEKLPVAAAAFATGALVHSLDFDDTHPVALVHPTAAILPVLSAVGQLTRAGTDTLEAAAVGGYELVTRLGAALPHGFHARGFHATSVCGVFAATLVAARLLGLSRAQAVDALGIAGSTAAGSMEYLAAGTATKPLHPALMAQAAVTSARLAAAGARGPDSIFEGRDGLFAAYLQARPPAGFAADLGRIWEVTRIDLKPYPCCHLSQATLLALRNSPVRPADVEYCAIDVPEASVPIIAEPRQHKIAPRSPYEAKFSLQWSAAAMLIDGNVTVETYLDVSRPEVTALAGRIDVRPVPFDVPPATAPARVSFRTRAGETATASSPGPGAASLDAIAVDKFVANAGGGERSRQFAQSVLDDGWRNP